jgi:hypothetical protein
LDYTCYPIKNLKTSIPKKKKNEKKKLKGGFPQMNHLKNSTVQKLAAANEQTWLTFVI